MSSGPVRQLLTKVGLLPLKVLARPEEPRVVRGSSRRRIPALFVLIVVLIVIASLEGQPLATAPAQAKLFPPGKEPYQIPLRWCALMGTPAAKAGGGVPAGAPFTTDILLDRQMRANQIWTPGASITFRSALPSVAGPFANFPVIDDPRPPRVGIGCPGPNCNSVEHGGRLGPGEQGDIRYPDTPAAAAEWLEARAECEEDWDHMEQDWGVSIKGTIVLNIGQFVDADNTPRTTIGRAEPLTIFSTGGVIDPEAGCETPPNRVTAVGETFMSVVDYSLLRAGDQAERDAKDKHLVAHELGHTLSLGHGNGVDDDGDIKYDEICDPGEPVPFPGPPPTLMTQGGDSSNVITTLQRGTSRGIARVTPGSQIDPPFELVNADTLSDRRVDDAQDVIGASLDMTGVGMTINPKQERVILYHTLFGLVSKDESTEYAAFLDLDSDPTTGGRPAELGFPTRFKGAELVTRVRVKGGKIKRVRPGQVGLGRTATPTVWRFEGGEFAKVTNSEVTATVSAPVGEELPFPIFDVVSAQLPADLVGHVGSRVRLQAITAGKGKDWVDVLPGERVRRRVPAGSADLYMTPPTFPACTTIPEVAQPGDVVTLKATGFDAPGEEVDVFLDAEHVANAELNRAGNMSTDVAIPKETRGEPHPITIRVGNSALTAECVATTASTRGPASPTATASPTASALGESGGPPVTLVLTLAATLGLVASGVIALSIVFRNP